MARKPHNAGCEAEPGISIPERATVTLQLAAILRGHLQAGAWTGFLPPERQLAERFQVSRPTLRAALNIIEREGLIDKGPRRRTRVTTGSRKKSLPPTRVVMLSAKSFFDVSLMYLLVPHLRRYLRQAGCELEVVMEKRLSAGNPGALIEQAAARGSVGCWLLISQSPSVQQFFQRRRLPAIIIGTRCRGVRLPAVDLDYRAVCRHAAGVLLRHGHRRIGLVMPRVMMSGDHAGRNGFYEAIEAGGHPDVEVVELRHGDEVREMSGILDRCFQSPAPPTALLVFKTLHLVATVTHLMHRGFRIPRDVSILSRDDRFYMSAVIPSISRYSADLSRFPLLLSKEVRHIIQGKKPHDRQALIEPVFIRGESIAPPPSP